MPDFNTLESLTVTRETGERLKAAGFPQDTYAAWGYSQTGNDYYLRPAPDLAPYTRVCAAPTLEEIGRLIPEEYILPRTAEDAALLWLSLAPVGTDGEGR